MQMLVHPTHLVLSFASLSNEIFCGSFLIENLVVCVPSTTAKSFLFSNHMNKKVVGGIHNVHISYADDSAPDSSGIVLCNTFK